MADDIPDLYDVEDYDAYEAQYADDFDMIEDEEEPEDIDFEAIALQKQKFKKKELDKQLFQNSSKFKFPTSLTNNAIKRACPDESSDEELRYSDDDGGEDERDKETVHTKIKNGLQPKKLKLDDVLKESEVKSSANNELKKLISEIRSNPLKDDMGDLIYQKRVFKRPVLSMDSVNVTSTDGDRVYLRLQPNNSQADDMAFHWQNSSSEHGLNLLAVPFDQLKNEVLQKRHEKLLSGRNTSNAEKNHRWPVLSFRNDNKERKFELWVEKYHPRNYAELLSDDGTNRVLLKWLKLWDQVVFDKQPEGRKRNLKGHTTKTHKFSDQNNNKNGNFVKKQFNIEDDLIALLCGNPGLGKTTLAHVISKHAGYNVVEMNASDDRSPEVFLNKIETTTQMKAVLGASKKPNCLIIDEIDGAPGPAIKILLDIVKATDGGVMKKKKLKKKKDFLLNRPIICICNDQYVPALRQLRQVAFNLSFPQTLASRLAGRLLTISQSEGLRIDMGCLLQLADKTENDIRSCLNTLQFINEQSSEVKPEDIMKLDVGQKDIKKGLRAILNEVFQLPRSTKKMFGKMSYQNKTDRGNKTSSSARFYNMLHLVSGNSEIDKLSQGLFDQYLYAKTKDPYMESVNLGADWLQCIDAIQKRIQQTQDYVLYRYAPYLPVAFHMYFAKASAPKIPYSNVAYDNHMKLSQNKQTLEQLESGIQPRLRRFCSIQTLTSDLVPFLYFIAIPSLRPVNTQLYSESEKQILSSLISTMISYNLTYRQERNKEGQYMYLLEPNIEELITYSGLPQHKHLPYATKQMIAREVELEKMRMAETTVKTSSTQNDSANTKANSSNSSDIVGKQKLTPKTINNTGERPTLDFFGRVVQPIKESQKVIPLKRQEMNKKKALLETNIWYKFNEGYTNAVRRTVKVHEFF